MLPDIRHRFTVRPPGDSGSGRYRVEFPDFPGCVSEGTTVEEAILNGWRAVSVFDKVADTSGAGLSETKAPVPVRAIWEIAEDISASVPEEAWDEVPRDLAANYKHYLYGTRKPSE